MSEVPRLEIRVVIPAGSTLGLHLTFPGYGRPPIVSGFKKNAGKFVRDNIQVGDHIESLRGIVGSNIHQSTFNCRVNESTLLIVSRDGPSPDLELDAGVRPNDALPQQPAAVTDNATKSTRKAQQVAGGRCTNHLNNLAMQSSSVSSPLRQQNNEDGGIKEDGVSTPPPNNYGTPPAAVNNTTEPPPIRHVHLYFTMACKGFRRVNIDNLNVCDEDKKLILRGFSALVSNAIRGRAGFEGTANADNQWPQVDESWGYLTSHKGDSWELMRDRHCTMSFHKPTCKKNASFSREFVEDGRIDGCCSHCWAHKYSFIRLCRSEGKLVQQYEDGGNPVQSMCYVDRQYRDPAWNERLLEQEKKRSEARGKRIKRWEKLLKMTENDVEVPNVNADVLFDAKELERLYESLKSKEEIKDVEIFDFIFKESMLVKKRINESGSAKGHRYSPILIQFAVMLRSKMSLASYEFFQKAFNLPNNTTLCRYSNADSSTEDGLMHETLVQMARSYDNRGIERGSFKRMMNLGWDSHVIRGHLGYDPHSKSLVGYADDAFKMDVIAQQFKKYFGDEVEATVEDGEDATCEEVAADNVSNRTEDIQLGKHYMVFMVQSWVADGGPTRFIVARYCLHALSASWIHMRLLEIVPSLAFYGFVVNAFGFDGASENRSAMKRILNLSLKDVLPELMLAPPPPPSYSGVEEGYDQNSYFVLEEEENIDNIDRYLAVDNTTGQQRWPVFREEDLPWEKKVAVSHPTVCGAIIVAGSDMPHLVKKFGNGIENSTSESENRERNLHLNGLPIQLKMAHDAWLECPDSRRGATAMRFPKLKEEVFVKNAKSRMDVSLAARAQGNSIIQCIETFGKNVNVYESYLLHCRFTNRFIDIMNGNNGCSNINSPNHDHIFELLKFVTFHTHWRAQALARKIPTLYFAESTYEDLVWTAIGVVLIAMKQLPANTTMIQRRHGSDHLEELFCMKRNANANATALDTQHIIARQTSAATMGMTRSRKANGDRRDTYSGAELDQGAVKRQKIEIQGERMK